MQNEYVGWVVSERDAFALECEDDAAAQFAEDGVALVDTNADLNGVGDGAAFDLVYAQDDGVSDCYVLEG